MTEEKKLQKHRIVWAYRVTILHTQFVYHCSLRNKLHLSGHWWNISTLSQLRSSCRYPLGQKKEWGGDKQRRSLKSQQIMLLHLLAPARTHTHWPAGVLNVKSLLGLGWARPDTTQYHLLASCTMPVKESDTGCHTRLEDLTTPSQLYVNMSPPFLK